LTPLLESPLATATLPAMAASPVPIMPACQVSSPCTVRAPVQVVCGVASVTESAALMVAVWQLTMTRPAAATVTVSCPWAPS